VEEGLKEGDLVVLQPPAKIPEVAENKN